MGPKKKKGCITILLLLTIFVGFWGCTENNITNAPVDSQDGVGDVDVNDNSYNQENI